MDTLRKLMGLNQTEMYKPANDDSESSNDNEIPCPPTSHTTISFDSSTSSHVSNLNTSSSREHQNESLDEESIFQLPVLSLASVSPDSVPKPDVRSSDLACGGRTGKSPKSSDSVEATLVMSYAEYAKITPKKRESHSVDATRSMYTAEYAKITPQTGLWMARC